MHQQRLFRNAIRRVRFLRIAIPEVFLFKRNRREFWVGTDGPRNYELLNLAPPRLLGLVMGIWFLAAALGNKLAGVLAGEFKSEDAAGLSTFFWQQAIWVGVATAVLFALVPWVKKLMGGVR